MKIAIVAPVFAPYSGVGGDGDKLGDLVAWLVRKSVAVHVVSRMPSAERAGAYSLARRLMPVQVEVAGAAQKWFRFDGRTATGAEVILLLPDAALSPEASDAGFGLAAEAVIAGFPEGFDNLIAWNNVTTFETVENRTQTVSVIDDDGVALDCSGIFDRILIHGSRRGERLLAQESALRIMVDIHDAAVVPRWVPDALPLQSGQKLSAKAMVQSEFGLPVRPDVPLLFVDRGAVQSGRLEPLLAQNVQVMVAENPRAADAFDRLSQAYPDRFAVLPTTLDSAAMIAPADFAVVEEEAFRARLAVSLGTLPICTAEMLDAPVDLAPDLSSGNCVLFGTPPERSFGEAIGIALGNYTDPRFRDVPVELQKRATMLSRVAEIYMALLSHGAGEP